MNIKLVVLLLGLSLSADAAIVARIPASVGRAALVTPALVPVLNAGVLPTVGPASLPVYPVPSIGIMPARLPGAPSPLPLPTPLALVPVKPVALTAHRAAASIDETFTLDWSLLDGLNGDEGMAVAVPNTPGPKPLPPAGAAAELRDASSGREPIRMNRLFDGRRESLRELELPAGRYL